MSISIPVLTLGLDIRVITGWFMFLALRVLAQVRQQVRVRVLVLLLQVQVLLPVHQPVLVLRLRGKL